MTVAPSVTARGLLPTPTGVTTDRVRLSARPAPAMAAGPTTPDQSDAPSLSPEREPTRLPVSATRSNESITFLVAARAASLKGFLNRAKSSKCSQTVKDSKTPASCGGAHICFTAGAGQWHPARRFQCCRQWRRNSVVILSQDVVLPAPFGPG